MAGGDARRRLRPLPGSGARVKRMSGAALYHWAGQGGCRSGAGGLWSIAKEGDRNTALGSMMASMMGS